METVKTTELPKKKGHAVIWYGLGTLALGTLAFFGIKHFKKSKDENNDSNDQKSNLMDTDTPVQTPAYHKSNPGLSPARSSDAFPLRLGSKGDKVRLVQQALLRTYGNGILAKFGADGQFGKELESALRSKGYGIPLQEADFLKITQAGKQEEEAKQTPPPLLSFDPSAIAKGIYYSIMSRDFNTSITLLKGIKNTTDYALVSEQLKNYRIAGVRQTLVNALLNTFTETSQRIKIQDTLKNIGLKYDGNKWSLS